MQSSAIPITCGQQGLNPGLPRVTPSLAVTLFYSQLFLSHVLPGGSVDGSDGIVGLDWTPSGVRSSFAHLSIDESPITGVVNDHCHPTQPPCNISWHG